MEENLLLIKNNDIKTVLMQNDFIESFQMKKISNTLKIKINEKKPIAILINKKKYYLSEKLI